MFFSIWPINFDVEHVFASASLQNFAVLHIGANIKTMPTS